MPHPSSVLATGLALAATLMASLPAAELPDPLVAADGTPVATAADWTQRRAPELLEHFRSQVYGRDPVGRPTELTFTVATTPGMMDGAAVRKLVRIGYGGPGGKGGFELVMFVPTKKPAPTACFVFINNRGRDDIDPTRAERKAFWPAEAIIARGYATAAFDVAEVDPDKHDEFKDGVHALFDAPGRPRAGDAWGTIAAWAWAASRAIDYLETDTDIDATRVAVVGHSRGGKTALWCGAQDRRVALTISNNSGCTGAAPSRIKGGETIKRINTSFPHWFCRNYRAWNDRDQEVPVDQHQLLALIAPRLLYVASASDDAWADPAAEFRACAAASPVYALLGAAGVGASAQPAPEQPLHTGRIGYHLRTGKHDLTEYDWARFMDFADRHMPAKP